MMSTVLLFRAGAIAKIEARADLHVSNLRRVIEAMGGELQIVARFPEGAATIRNFAGIGEDGGTVG